MTLPATYADDSIISVVEENTWPDTPTSPSFLQGRSTGDNLKPEISKNTSQELNPSADITSVFPTKGGASGDLNFELSYGLFFDLILEHSFRGSFDAFGVCKAGTARKSFTAEKQIFVDGTPFYKRYPGLRINSLAIELDRTSEAAITGTISLMGQTEESSETELSGATYTEPALNQVFYMPETRSMTLTGDGISGEYCFRRFSFTINNNCREQQGTCTGASEYPDYNAKGIAYGKREVTQDGAVYFRDLELNDAFKGDTPLAESFILSNGDQGYKFTFPSLILMTDETPIEGTNSDVIENFTGQGILDTTEGCSILVEKIPSLATDAGIKLTSTGTPSPDDTGTYYKDGTTHNAKDVYASIDGTKAIWWDTVETAWTVTAYGDIGTFPTTGWECTTTAAPTGSFAAVGGATGDLTGAAYDPTA